MDFICNEAATRKVWFWALSVFSALENKEALIGKILWRFDIPEMINTLWKIMTTVHEEMLNAPYLYWLHNDKWMENNSLNGHSNEPWING